MGVWWTGAQTLLKHDIFLASFSAVFLIIISSPVRIFSLFGENFSQSFLGLLSLEI